MLKSKSVSVTPVNLSPNIHQMRLSLWKRSLKDHGSWSALTTTSIHWRRKPQVNHLHISSIQTGEIFLQMWSSWYYCNREWSTICKVYAFTDSLTERTRYITSLQGQALQASSLCYVKDEIPYIPTQANPNDLISMKHSDETYIKR